MFMNYKITLIILFIIIIFVFIYYASKNNIYNTADKINYFFSKYSNDPAVLNPNDFPWSINFRNSWKIIRDEYLKYTATNIIPYHNNINPIVARCDNNRGWKTLYLRAFGKNTKIANFFPKTMEIINKSPCTLAFFSVLEPGAKLASHIGIYKGVIRYHLGIFVPKEWHKCFINVNGTILHWREGMDIMFDDMYPHYVQNNTNERRVILFLDIKRDFHNYFLNMLNTIFLQFIKSNDALKDTIDNANSFSLNN